MKCKKQNAISEEIKSIIKVPELIVEKYARIMPDAYPTLDFLSEKDVFWPDYCELPISEAFAYFTVRHNMSAHRAGTLAGELTACWTWSRHKTVHVLDDALTETLLNRACNALLTDIIPYEQLIQGASKCTYVKANFSSKFDGFFCWIEYDENRKEPELRVQLVLRNSARTFPCMLHLIPGATYAECVDATYAETLKHMGPNPTEEMTDPTSFPGFSYANAKDEYSPHLTKALPLALSLLTNHQDIEEAQVLSQHNTTVHFLQCHRGD